MRMTHKLNIKSPGFIQFVSRRRLHIDKIHKTEIHSYNDKPRWLEHLWLVWMIQTRFCITKTCLFKYIEKFYH